MNYGIHSNSFQGDFKRVLCVCSAGMLRSPTIAHVLSAEPYNFNTRIAGTEPYALTHVTDDLLAWADEIVCADTHHAMVIRGMLAGIPHKDPLIVNLGIPDEFEYRAPVLIDLIRVVYNEKVPHE
jgi:predicted protein tyrosine phosphatase